MFAQATTTAVIYDVQTVFSQLLRRVLVFPLQAFEGIVTLALPLALMGRALLHKDWWRSGQALIALISAYLLSALFTYLLQLPVFNQVHNGMISYRNLNTYEILSPTYAALAAVILASGKHQSKLVKTSWWLLGIVVGVSVLRSAITLLAAVAQCCWVLSPATWCFTLWVWPAKTPLGWLWRAACAAAVWTLSRWCV